MTAEVLDGELFVMTRPHRRHVRAGSRLGALLDPLDWGDVPGGWVIVDEPELHLGRGLDIVDPDLAGWRRERLPKDFFAEDAPAHFDLVPEWGLRAPGARDRGDRPG
jgi:hypothetical protein